MVECVRFAFNRGGRNTGECGGSSFWLVLRSTKNAGMAIRYFLCAFNLFTGTRYFFFSGVTNFGDWTAVISGLYPHWLWRAFLVVGGAATYYAAVRVVAIGLVRTWEFRGTSRRDCES
jgi:hypothetical protein